MISALLLAAAAPALKCDGNGPQLELNICAWQEFERTDAALNVQWRRTVAVMKQHDREIDRSYDKEPGYYATLLAAQRAWLAYRDQHCLIAGFEARGGSMEPMLKSGCKAYLTRERTKQLKSLTENED